MIRPHQRQSRRKLHHSPMPKHRPRLRQFDPIPNHEPQNRIPRDLPQRKQHPLPLQQPPLHIQILRARRHLLRQRLIPRRRTPCRRADVTPAQLQPIAASSTRRLIRQSRPMQRREQKIPRPIPGKHPPRPIRPMRRRRETDDPQPSLRIPKPRHRLPPILPIRKRPLLRFRNFRAIPPQSRTSLASDDLSIQLLQRFQVHNCIPHEQII